MVVVAVTVYDDDVSELVVYVSVAVIGRLLSVYPPDVPASQVTTGHVSGAVACNSHVWCPPLVHV